MRFKAFSSLLAGLLLVVVACLLGDPAHAQRKRGQTPAAQPSNSNTSAPKQDRPKQVFIGRGSDTPRGSRMTITGDNPLNDYSAYRSGDRFYVELPNANADTVARAAGRGFTDMQVQRRGKSVVLSYRVQPGARPRVEQRFNRLDVVFDVPEGGQPADAQASTRPSPQTQETRTPDDAAQQNAGQTQPPATERRPATTTDPATQPQQNPLTTQPAQPQPGVELTAPPADAALAGQTPTPEAAQPAATEIAQVEPPKTVAPITTTTAQPGTTLGTTLLNNWYWVVLALAVAGIGLLFAARRSSAAPLPPPALEEEEAAAAAVVPLKSPRARKLKKASAEATLGTAEVTSTSVTKPIVIASALAASTAADKKKEKAEEKSATLAEETTLADSSTTADSSASTDSSAVAESEVKAEPISEPVAEPVAETAAAEVASGDAAVVDEAAVAAVVAAADEKQIEPVAVETQTVETKAIAPAMSVDAEAAQAEAKRLLGGEDYDRAVVGTSDAMARQLIASELLSALAGRNADRRERARAAYVDHGYFDEVTRDLRGASAPAERASAARNLALVGDRAATPHLVAALNDRSVEVRRAAVEALATLRDPAAAEPLEALLKREKTEKTKVNRKLVQRAADACRDAAKDAPAPVVEAATTATAAEATATEAEGTDTTTVVEAGAATVEAATTEVEAARAELEAAPAEALEETTVAEPSVEPAAEQEMETLVSEREAETLVSEQQPFEAIVSEPEAVSAPEALEETAQPVEESAPVAESAAPEAVEETTAEVEEAASVEAEAAATAEVEETTLVAEREEASEPVAESVEESFIESSVEESFVESSVEAAPLEIEEPSAVESHEPTPLFDAGARPAAGEWVEFDMTAIEAVPEETAVEPLFEASSGEALSTASSEAQTTAVAPFVSEATGVVPFESERAVEESRPSWMDETTVVERAETGAAETVEQPAEEFAPAASSVGEKGVELFDEYSTVPTSIQPRLASSEATERAEAIAELSRYDTADAFHHICAAFDDGSEAVRSAAARSLYELRADRADSFTRALRESSPERRRNIGAAISSSGLASDAISQLTGESREKTYEAFSLLFLMAKAGEVQPLIRAIESHPNNEVRLAVVKLLALSGQKEILPAFRRLAVRGSLPTEVRSAVMEAIYQISSGQPTPA